MNFALNIIGKTSLILLSAGLLSMLFGRASASTRHAMWMLALISVLLLPASSMLMPQLDLPILPQTSTSVAFLPADSHATAAPGVERGLKPSTTYLAETLWLQPAFIWILGVAFLIVRLLMGMIAVRRLAASAVKNEDGSWHELVKQLSGALSILRPIRLLFSDAQVSPMTWGVVRHTVLLPSSATQWSEDRRRLVLAHELAHVKRNDGMMQVFIQVVCSLYWFNPLTWYAAHRVRIERERACDDHVLNLGAVAEDYADHLVQIVRGLRTRPGLSHAAVSIAEPSELETRLVSILDPRNRRQSLSKPAAAFLCVVTGLLTISMAAIAVTGAMPLPPVAKLATAPQRTRIGDAGAIPTNLVVPPHVIESVPPIYTDEGLAARIEGIVTLEAAVDSQGKVTILRVVKGLGYGLDQRAIRAALSWKFVPAIQNGIPVQAVAQIDVDFKLPPEIPFRVGGGITAPLVISRVEPQYTDEARNLKYRGTVVLSATVGVDGTVKVEKAIRELDHGLTESAIAALEQWKFKPGVKDGKPVPISLNIEVNFNLK